MLRHNKECALMSQLGQSRRFADARGTSAVRSFSDIPDAPSRAWSDRGGGIHSILIGQRELFCSDFALITAKLTRNAGVILHVRAPLRRTS